MELLIRYAPFVRYPPFLFNSLLILVLIICFFISFFLYCFLNFIKFLKVPKVSNLLLILILVTFKLSPFRSCFLIHGDEKRLTHNCCQFLSLFVCFSLNFDFFSTNKFHIIPMSISISSTLSSFLCRTARGGLLHTVDSTPYHVWIFVIGFLSFRSVKTEQSIFKDDTTLISMSARCDVTLPSAPPLSHSPFILSKLGLRLLKSMLSRPIQRSLN